MNGSWNRNNEKDSKENKGEGSGWASTFLKVAGAVAATAAVAGSLYSILNQPEADVAPHGVQQTHRRRHHHDDEEEEEEEEVMILHVDGSLKSERQSAGCGGYLSSKSQNWICGFVQKLKFTPNLKEHEPEKEAILRGLHWVKGKGKSKVVVNSDCQSVVKFVNSGHPSIDPLICEIRDFLESDEWEVTLNWIPRTKNGEADKLSKKAHSCRTLELHQSPNRSYLLNLNNQIPHIWYE